MYKSLYKRCWKPCLRIIISQLPDSGHNYLYWKTVAQWQISDGDNLRWASAQLSGSKAGFAVGIEVKFLSPSGLNF